MAMLLWAVTFHLVTAYPSLLDCDYSCMGSYTPGAAFNYMSVATIGATSGDTCKITTNIPTDGYHPTASYTVTVTSTTALAQKVVCSAGTFGSLTQANAGSEETSHSYTWTAPSSTSGSASFRALCGNQGEMWYAAEVTESVGSGPFTTATTSTTSTTTAAGDAAGVEIGSGMRMYADVANGQDADIEVTSTGDGWSALGFIEGSSVSMTGGSGGGNDAFICSGGEVKRYWITSYTTPSGGVAVPGSSCSMVSGNRVMRFKRPLAASSATEIAMTPGTSQMVIWAHGNSPTLSQHGSSGSDRGGSMVDFATLSAVGATKAVGPALFLHVILMVIGWGTLLPWGVAIANRTRTVSNAKPGAWFKWHKRLQSIGWLIQLVGFGMAIWHVQENGTHFSGPHQIIGLVVVIIGTSQPFNALLRKLCAHPTPGDDKTTGRLVWEIAHKGLGYFATLLGMVNCWVGVALLIKGEYEVAAIAVAATLSSIGTLSVTFYFILSLIQKDNCISRMLVSSSHAAVKEIADETSDERPSA
ncbi:Cytochrome b561 [Durusdinium trenchii]|uniref:DM13 and DOMON domain-containing protein At5g54830 (Protein b561A.tha1) n=1 Tax=Durusdinium trenchii TaxID=1381693 RepID=A0ABP0IGR9_9DINO